VSWEASKKRDARGAVEVLLEGVDWEQMVSWLLRKGASLYAGVRATNSQNRQEIRKLEAIALTVGLLNIRYPKAAACLAEGLLIAQTESGLCEWITKFHSADPTTMALLNMIGSDTSDSSNAAQTSQVAELYLTMQRQGAPGNTWSNCVDAVTTLGSTHDAAAHVDWLLAQQLLVPVESWAPTTTKKQNGHADDAESVPVVAQAIVQLQMSWQQMVDKKLFDNSMDGDTQIEQMVQALEWGANIESTHVQGRHPLHNAARNNQPLTINWLLENGAAASPSAGGTGWTPLHNAINFHGNQGHDFTQVIRNLVNGRADTSAQIVENSAWKGRTPLELAVKLEKKDIEDIIRLHGV